MQKRLLIVPAGLILALGLLLLGHSPVQASPAAPLPVTLSQPDGSSFQALPWGDEWANGFEDLAGHTLLQDARGWWSYARPDGSGNLVTATAGSNGLVVGRDDPAGLPLHLRPPASTSGTTDLPFKALPAPSTEPEYHLPPAGGDMKVLVLLVKFTDRAETYPASYFQQLLFGPSGSLKSFYAESSYGSLNIVPAQESCGSANDDGVADWRELPYVHPNTGTATTEANLQLAKDILTLNDDCIDFASFDSNHDGHISGNELQFVVVVAGYERAYTVSSPSIWAHSFYLDFIGIPVLDGVEIGGYYDQSWYAEMGEIHGTSLTYHAATVGILAHEFGHLLNLPDLYDVDGSTEGVGRWSIMGSGGWNQTGTFPGDTPAQPDAWSKWYEGWLTPTEVNGTLADQPIERVEDHPQAYLLRPNPYGVDWVFEYHVGRGEYFLVENRQQALSDAGLPGCGLLIWHINEKATFNNYANAYDATPLVGLEQADGANHLAARANRGDPGDPYPGTSANQDFNLTSLPNSRRLDGGLSGVSVHVDSETCGDTMQADLTYSLNKYILNEIAKADTACNAWAPVLQNDFETGSLEGWVTIDKNGTDYGEYYPAVRSCRAYSGTNSVWMVGGGADGTALDCGDHYPDRAIPWMIYGPFSTLGETAMKVDFKHWTHIEPRAPYQIYDRFCIWGSQNNSDYYGYCTYGDWRGWADYVFNLKDPGGFYDFLNKPQVWIAIGMMTDDFVNYPEGVYVDDLRLDRCTSGASAALPALSVTPAAKQELERFDPSTWLDPFTWRLDIPGSLILGPFHIRLGK